MHVELLTFTGKGSSDEQWAAADLLLFTKNTRLEMNPGLMKQIQSLSKEQKAIQLEYMANTIPSSWEFIDYVFLVSGVSRAYTHQQVRTRVASYAQQSLRVVDQSNFEYIFTKRNRQSEYAMAILDECLEKIKRAYRDLIMSGQSTEDARGILPTNIATNIVCKFNMRTFVDLARARMGGRTQDEYRRVVAKMVECVLIVHPWMSLFIFGNKQRDYFTEIEAFAEQEFGGDLLKKGQLLKIVDAMRKGTH